MSYTIEGRKPINTAAEEGRKLIAEALERGAENIAAEIVTQFGLEAEYPELIAKVDAERS